MIVALLTLWALFSLIPQAFADYLIDPLRLELKFKPGQNVVSGTVKVRNIGDEPIRLQAYFKNWKMNELGALILVDEDIPFGVANQARFNPREFEVPPKKSIQVRLAISLPPDSQDGEYRSILYFEDLKTQEQRLKTPDAYAASIIIKKRQGIGIYAYKGALASKPSLSDVSCNLDEKGKLVTTFTLTNQGARHYRGIGTFLLSRVDPETRKETIYREIPLKDLAENVVLPSSRRQFQEVLLPRAEVEGLVPGQYKVALNFVTKNEPEVAAIEKTTEFIAPPGK